MPRPTSAGCACPAPIFPVLDPAELRTAQPDAVLLFVADLLTEVRADYPEVEAAGGSWVVADSLGA